MRFCRISSYLAVAILAFGMTGIAKADGGDPRGATHTPGVSGTPYETSNQFDLAPFGTTNDPTGICTFDASIGAGGEEDCTLKNMSGSNWADIAITLGGISSCQGISASSDLFLSATCDLVNGTATLEFDGVAYSAAAEAFITQSAAEAATCPAAAGCTGPIIQQTLLTNPPTEAAFTPLCGSTAAGDQGGTPGVMAGCDVTFTFNGDSSGDWTPGQTFSVLAPEPSALPMLALGLLAMMFLGSRFRTARNN
jgi:hypothetical protein